MQWLSISTRSNVADLKKLQKCSPCCLSVSNCANSAANNNYAECILQRRISMVVYGNLYVAMFVSFCIRLANISNQIYYIINYNI